MKPRDIIKSKGLKATPQRIAVYEAMMDIGHASADMLIDWLRTKDIELTVATVYNVLESFVNAGIIRKLSSDGIKMFYDINTHDHVHIYCENSNMISDFGDKDRQLMKMVNNFISENKSEDFHINGVEVLIKGQFNK